MIEKCTYCQQEHDTGDLKPIEGVPVKTCPEITWAQPIQVHHPRTIKILHNLGYCDVIHQPPPPEIPNYYAKRDEFPPLKAITGIPFPLDHNT